LLIRITLSILLRSRNSKRKCSNNSFLGAM